MQATALNSGRIMARPWRRHKREILAIVRRCLPGDWTERYNTTPVLKLGKPAVEPAPAAAPTVADLAARFEREHVTVETFVETPRYTGAVYKASGWIPVGATQGRGRYDRHTKRAQPKKNRPADGADAGRGGPRVPRACAHPDNPFCFPVGRRAPGSATSTTPPGAQQGLEANAQSLNPTHPSPRDRNCSAAGGL